MSIVRKGRIDPIEILREYTIQKKAIILKQKKDRNNPYNLVFDNIELKCNMETAWKSNKTGREYNLGALWWFLDSHLKSVDSKEYRSKAFEMGIDFVGMLDQQEIIDYFTGKRDYTDCINAERKSQLFKNNKDDQEEPGMVKKIKSEEPLNEEEFKLRVIDEIVRFEKPITTRNRQFRTQDKTFDLILQQSKKILSGQNVSSSSGKEVQLSFQGSLLYEILKLKQKPLIIVPQIQEIGNLCLKNVKAFLEEGIYNDPTTLSFTAESRFVDVTAKLKSVSDKVVFQITDMTNQLDQKSWNRVVAIFIRGSSYELKNIPTYLEIGKKIQAYHFKFEEDPPKDPLKQWNGLKIFDLHRSKRHLDKSIKNTFWEDFEEFLLHPAIH